MPPAAQGKDSLVGPDPAKALFPFKMRVLPMIRLRAPLAAAIIIACGALTAAPAAAQTAEERRQLDWSIDRGRLLFALDRVAWVATDDVRNRIPDLVGSGIAGYIVDSDDQGFTAIFYGREDERLVTVYRARIAASGVVDPRVFERGQRPALTPRQVRLVRAAEAARQTDVARCTQASPNLSVVPPATDGDPVDVYITAPQMRPGRVQFGGHHRISFDASGREIARRPFTRQCLEVPTPTAELRQRGAMLGFNHLLDPIPNEVHVFLALGAQQPLAVMTQEPRRTWEVTGSQIRLMPNASPAPPR